MSELWIKICGITRAEDAAAAATLGADAVGVVFYPASPRAMSLDRLPDVLSALPDGLTRVALFVDPDPELVQQVCGTGLIDMLQFHGEESAEFCSEFGLPYIKALKVREGDDLLAIAGKYQSAHALLLDKFDENVPGGTGKRFDWELAGELVDDKRYRTVIAGGLDPRNVGKLVTWLHPDGVDVSSGVEVEPGIKSREKMQAFIEGARNG